MSDDTLYHFQSERGKTWASWNHPGLVKSVRRQLTGFWRRRAMLQIYQEVDYMTDARRQEEDTIPEGYVALFELAKEFDFSSSFSKFAAEKLETAKRIRYLAKGWNIPKWVWVAKEEEARPYYREVRAKQDRVLPKKKVVLTVEDAEEIPEGAMPISDIAKALGMNIGTLSRWVRNGELPRAGKYTTSRGRNRYKEVYTWPGPVVAEIIKRNEIMDGRRQTKWVGLEVLKRRGREDWIMAAEAYRQDKYG